ncbi:NTP transferase domain-containing protein [Patescibacteria group bacterium]|nr:NTP transferase domain-containing protein [Patescibacteria group bacterium]
MDKIRIVILAAGKGKRMNNHEVPKVLIDFKGQPLIQHLLNEVKASVLDPHPVIVVGRQAEIVKESLKDGYEFILQKELLGTGHAVKQTKEALRGKAENVMVLYGDHPYLTATSIKKLADIHISKNHLITLMTFKVPDFENQYSFAYDFGRIARDEHGNIREIVEKKDANEEQSKITELNPAYFCFQAEWLWENLEKLKNDNVQKEYYLTDLAKIAIDQGLRIDSIDIDPKEAIGINTPEQLELAKKIKINEH